MLKIKDLFKKKNKTNTKYQIGDTVYLLAYPFRRFCFGNGKTEVQGIGEQVKLLKMKITRIENCEHDNNTRYYTDTKTGLEHNFGGYYGFDSWETIQEAINRFVDDDYKNLVEKVEK